MGIWGIWGREGVGGTAVVRKVMECAGNKGEARPLSLGSQALQEEGAVRMAGVGGEGAVERIVLDVDGIVEGEPAVGLIEEGGRAIGFALPVGSVAESAARRAVLIVGGSPVELCVGEQSKLGGKLRAEAQLGKGILVDKPLVVFAGVEPNDARQSAVVVVIIKLG